MKVRNIIALMSIGAPAALGLTVTPAAAATVVTCGQSITTSTTLLNSLSNCPGDGLVVTGSNITLNLGGQTISAANGPGDNAGIRLVNVSGVTITDGTVRGFDDGVAIFGGSRNTVKGLVVRDNINDFTGATCDLGEGIGIFDSSNNTIEGNQAIHNGLYGGISLVGNSDSNLVQGNQVLDNNVTAPDGTQCFIDNHRQDEGIRVEGPGADYNRIQGNTIRGNLLAGIGLHSANTGAGEAPNTHTIIIGNSIHSNGYAISGDGPGGITILPTGPISFETRAFANTITGNVSSDNVGDGILISESSNLNIVQGNTVNNNSRDGIAVLGPFNGHGSAHDNTLVGNVGSGNGRFDGHDGNVACDNNHWHGNHFVTFTPSCVASP